MYNIHRTLIVKFSRKYYWDLFILGLLLAIKIDLKVGAWLVSFVFQLSEAQHVTS